MGIIEVSEKEKQLFIRSVIHFYGNAADEELSRQIALDIANQWNEPAASVLFKRNWYEVYFEIEGLFRPDMTPSEVIENINPVNNYFRVENYARGNISFVDGIGSNTGYFLKENLLHHSTTAAHEYGHTLGLYHPLHLDIRGSGTPGIMYPRGTLVDPEFQYDPSVPAGMKGGTLNPFKRRVLISDIASLKIDNLHFSNNVAVIGNFSSVWHDADVP